jgi:hypothetical protein
VSARERIRVATHHSNLPLSVTRSPVTLKTAHVLTFDRMFKASEDVTGALHAATRRLRLICRSTIPRVIYRVRHAHSGISLTGRCTVRRMRNKAKLLYSCATFHKTKINLVTSNNLPKPPPVTHQHLLLSTLLITKCFLCLDSEVTDVTGHLLDAGERRAGDLVAAEAGVDVDEDTGL